MKILVLDVILFSKVVMVMITGVTGLRVFVSSCLRDFVIKNFGLPLRGRLILSITRMITDRIGLHSIVLPLLICYKISSTFAFEWNSPLKNPQGKICVLCSKQQRNDLLDFTFPTEIDRHAITWIIHLWGEWSNFHHDLEKNGDLSGEILIISQDFKTLTQCFPFCYK